MKKHIKDTQAYWITTGVAFTMALLVISFALINFSREMDLYAALPPSASGLHQKSSYAFIEIDYGNTRRRLFRGPISSERYMFESVLSNISQIGNVAVQLDDGSIKTLDRIGDGGLWKIYRNGVLIHEPINRLMVQRDDYYTIRFEP